MGKREHGTGSVTEYRPGKWQIKRADADGGRQSKSGFTDDKTARKALAAILTDLDRGDYFDERKGKVPFGEVARQHPELADLAPGSRRDRDRSSLEESQRHPVAARHASLSSSMRYLHSDDERDEEIALLASRRIAGQS